MVIDKNNPLIIDQYNKRPFYQRMVSDGATTFIWGAYAWIFRLHHVFNLVSIRLFILGVPDKIQDPAVALISTSGILMLWNTLNEHDGPTITKIDRVDYAKYFNMELEKLDECRNSQVCIVHHDEHGNVTNIFSKNKNNDIYIRESESNMPNQLPDCRGS
jgi:poly-beta-1,6-N-acetyl-D-glucosamine biosynthesis protein PgaD